MSAADHDEVATVSTCPNDGEVVPKWDSPVASRVSLEGNPRPPRLMPECRARLKKVIFGDSCRPKNAQRASESVLRECTREIQRSLERYFEDLQERGIRQVEALGWASAALYVADSTNSVLEAVAATDANVAGVVRHRLPQLTKGLTPLLSRDAWDIEVCTYLHGQAERLGSALDPRYNPYVYASQRHARFQDRVFIPLFLVRDGLSLRQRECQWERNQNIWRPSAGSYRLQVVGTLSVSNEEKVSEDVLRRTIRLATESVAPAAHASTIQGLCERIVGILANAAGAASAALHLTPKGHAPLTEQRAYARYLAGSGVDVGACIPGEVGASPRPGGMGDAACRRGLPIWFGRTEIEKRNEELAASDVIASAVFPLISAEGDSFGVLYLHQNASTPELIDITELVDLAAHTLNVALRSQRRNFLREHLLSESMRFAVPGHSLDAARLGAMAQFAWSVLGCDFVTLIYDDGRHRLFGQAGRRMSDWRRLFANSTNAAERMSELVAEEFGATLIPSVAQFMRNNASKGPYARASFTADEHVQATAVLPLDLKDSVAPGARGALVVDYRFGSHDFTDTERELLRHLAAFFAAGIGVCTGEHSALDNVLRMASGIEKVRVRDSGQSFPAFVYRGGDNPADSPPAV